MRSIKFLATSILSIVLIANGSSVFSQEYRWTDKNGTTHFTDDPENIPLEHRDKVQKQQRLKDRTEKTTSRRSKIHEEYPGSEETLPMGESEDLEEDIGKKGTGRQKDKSLTLESGASAWKKELSIAREKVTELEKQCKGYTDQRDINKQRSLLFARPIDRQNTQEAQEALIKCKQELRQTRHYLDVELPHQALRAGVPPGWLR